jgi:OOP family OmpA-OmpF porin
VGPEQERIENLEGRPPLSADSIATVLPESIAAATKEREQALTIALEPTVTRAVTGVARREPELYGEILAPTIVAAVRAALAEAIETMLARLDERLERTVSVRSIGWRIEARRTRRPFAEVVFLRTLAYRVEQVFLIHTPTSLVLRHLVGPDLGTQAPDQVAAMLAAIDAFGREAFGPMPDEAHLEKFVLGELTVWVTRDPALTLAAVVRGERGTSAGLATQLTDALMRVRVMCKPELLEISEGVIEPTGLAAADPILEPLIRTERRAAPHRAPLVLAAVGVLLALSLAGLLVATHSEHAKTAARERAYGSVLAAEPGIVVNRVKTEDGRTVVEGYRDPLSADPEKVLADKGLPPATLRLPPFVSVDPPIVERRAREVLAPPPGAKVAFEGGTLHVSGTASRDWVKNARLVARTLPGVSRVDDASLRPEEDLDVIRSVQSALERIRISFDTEEATPNDAQYGKLSRIGKATRDAMDAAASARVGTCLDVIGHADPPGPEAYNLKLSEKRAAFVEDKLASVGVPTSRMRSIGAGEWDVGGARARSVTFRLRTDESGARVECGAGS